VGRGWETLWHLVPQFVTKYSRRCTVMATKLSNIIEGVSKCFVGSLGARVASNVFGLGGQFFNGRRADSTKVFDVIHWDPFFVKLNPLISNLCLIHVGPWRIHVETVSSPCRICVESVSNS
jgi:hypothetical protein